MTASTELDVRGLGDQITHLNLPRGQVYLHVRRRDDGHTFEIDIPRGRILLLQPGYYDVTAGSEDQPARIAVFEGSARFGGNGADISITAGEGFEASQQLAVRKRFGLSVENHLHEAESLMALFALAARPQRAPCRPHAGAFSGRAHSSSETLHRGASAARRALSRRSSGASDREEKTRGPKFRTPENNLTRTSRKRSA